MARGKDKAAAVLEYFESVELGKAEVVLAFCRMAVGRRLKMAVEAAVSASAKKTGAKRGRKPRNVAVEAEVAHKAKVKAARKVTTDTSDAS